MKKFISVLLLLAMCVACFAGCTKEEGNPGLAAAKEYLYTMYKDNAEATGSDYDVAGQVMVDGVIYAVTWTVDNDTVQVVVNENKMVTIKIPAATENEVTYTLTATIADAEGKTETVTFAHKIPAAEKPNTDAKPVDVTLTNGMKVVIFAPSHGKALSSQPQNEGSFYQKGVDVTGYLTGYGDTEVWTVVANGDGTFSFAQNGQNLGLQDTYNSMGMGYVNDKWQVTSLGNGLYLICNTVRGNYIEWYDSKDNWSTYNTDGVATNPLFQMAFYVVG